MQQQQMQDITHARAPPAVVYAQLKFMWANGAQERSLKFLNSFASGLAKDMREANRPEKPDVARLLARCYFKLGDWQRAVKGELDEVRRKKFAWHETHET